MTPYLITIAVCACILCGCIGWLASELSLRARIQREADASAERQRVVFRFALESAENRATNALQLLERQTAELTAHIVKLTTPKTFDDVPGKSLSTDEADVAWYKEHGMEAGDPAAEVYGG